MQKQTLRRGVCEHMPVFAFFNKTRQMALPTLGNVPYVPMILPLSLSPLSSIDQDLGFIFFVTNI